MLLPTADHDVVVVGARCAGAATAMLLARQGLDVLVVDRAVLPSDTLSTHSLSRGGVVQLARWGLLDEVLASGAPKITTVAFHTPGAPPDVRTVKDRAGVDHLLAPRRYVLDAVLLDGARRAGASVMTEVAVTDVTRSSAGRVEGVELRDPDGLRRTVSARVVVGADGVRSRVARAVEARVLEARPADGAAHYLYVSDLPSEGFEFHLGDPGFAGVFRTNAGEANVWACVPADMALTAGGDRTDAFHGLLAGVAPSLAERVRRATVTSNVRSAVRLPNHVLEAVGAGWALVGDASYHRDPITGHGITDAFRDAELLAHHLGRTLRGEEDEPAAQATYEAERRRLLQPIFDVTVRLAAFPPPGEFTQLQRELSSLIEAEATWLASHPHVPLLDEVAA